MASASGKSENVPKHETARQYYQRRWNALSAERSSWISHWRDLADHHMPRRFRYLSTDQNRGEKKNQKIVNSTGTLSLRTLKSGMQAGVTSPARPWFRIRTPDPDLNEFRAVKVWLWEVESRMRQILSRSNFYNITPSVYRDLGLFGTAAAIELEDPETDVRFYSFPPGSYALGNSNRLMIDTLYREVSMSIQQMAEEFGVENLSQQSRTLFEQGKYSNRKTVLHAIEPNLSREHGKRDNRNMAYRSVYFEKEASEEEKFLRVSGFEERAFFAPRWEVVGEDPYGSECPGMVALGDVRALQLMEKRKAQALDKLVDPPLKAPSSMQDDPLSLLPGDVSYYSDAAGSGQQHGPSPLYEINPRLQELYQEIRATENRIHSSFYADLFLMLANDQRSNITAREIQERHEEKLLMLGPVLEKIHDEFLDPTIDRTFNIMVRRGLVPPPPPELQGEELRVEYISVLAQAQQMVGIGSLERSLGFVGQLAGLAPEAVDKVDTDKAIEEYWEMAGAPPVVLRSQDQVDATRQGRRQREQMQAALQAGEQAADAGQKLSETRTGSGRSALSELTGGVL